MLEEKLGIVWGFRWGEYELDESAGELRRGGARVPLEPQAFQVLALLVRQRDRVVTREELLDEVWRNRFVSEATLSHRIMEARKAVGDDGRAQRVIRTVHGRGFRFLAPATPQAEASAFVGREAELQALRDAFADSLRGERRTVLLSGEAGLGKTTLVDAFLAETQGALIARGDCLEHHGHPEPYLPVLDALGRLCREPGLVDVLSEWAPTWLAQMPGFAHEAVLRRAAGSTRERMLRELGEALEAAALRQPLVLVLEDLHWSDGPTLDLLTWVARRREPCRLLLIGTWRPPADAVQALAGDLALRGHAWPRALGRLGLPEAAALIRRRRPEALGLAEVLCERAGGNPLFMNCLLDAYGEGLPTEPPESLRDLIERLLARLPEGDRAVLEGAAVIGAEFTAAAAAAAAAVAEEEAERRCRDMARRGAFLAAGAPEEWPDGTSTSGFAFRHALYAEVLYRWLPAGTRARMHGRAAARLEAGLAGPLEVGRHWEAARERARAAPYLALAAEAALRRNAPADAVLLLDSALLGSPGMARLHRLRATALIASRGWSDPEVEPSLRRAMELASGEEFLTAQYALATLYEMRGEYARCSSLLEQRQASEGPAVDSDELMACSAFHQGEFARSLEHAERGACLYDPERHLDLTAQYGDNPGVACHAWGALSLWFLGFPDAALARVGQAVDAARERDHTFALALALVQAGTVHLLRGEPERVLACAEEALATAAHQYHRAIADVLAGWALRDPERLDSGLASYRATGARIDLPLFLCLRAEVREGAEARASLTEAASFAGPGRGIHVEAEIHRLQGDCRTALEVARRQGSLSLELRAACGLGDRDLVAAVLARFREGHGTRDLRLAAAMLG